MAIRLDSFKKYNAVEVISKHDDALDLRLHGQGDDVPDCLFHFPVFRRDSNH